MDRAFEAPELIELMDEAEKYNQFLIDELVSWSGGMQSVLDFGAGNGRFSVALHAKGLNVHAIEPDRELRARIGAQGVQGHESLGALRGQRFDGIYSINVLEHIDDDMAVLRDFHDRLRAGGSLLLYVPAFRVLFSANDVRVGHVRRYRKSTLLSRVIAAGFRPKRVQYVDSLGFAAGLLYRFFGNRDGGLSVRTIRLYDRFIFPISRMVDAAFGGIVGKNLLLVATRP